MQGIPNFAYSEKDFTFNCASWEAYNRKSEPSKFDKLLSARWDKAMSEGVFKYDLSKSDIQYRILPGKHKFVLTLALERARNRRAPEFVENVNKPFDPSRFNFTKVKTAEVIMNLCPGSVDEQHNGHEGVNGVLRDQEEDNAAYSLMSKNDVKQLILLNISPFAYGHILLVPDVDMCINQKVTHKGMKLAIDTILLSNHPGFRMAFNGLCALASVNHQHLHGWYMDTPLWIETCPVKHVSGLCYEVHDRISRAFIFQLNGTTPDRLARAVFTVTNYFQENDIAHNMFMTRGKTFEDSHSKTTTVRIIVWPRKHFIGARSTGDWESEELPLFYVAVAELGGHIPTYQPHRFDDVTEEEIVSIIQESLLPDEEFNRIREHVKSLMIDLDRKETL